MDNKDRIKNIKAHLSLYDSLKNYEDANIGFFQVLLGRIPSPLHLMEMYKDRNQAPLVIDMMWLLALITLISMTVIGSNPIYIWIVAVVAIGLLSATWVNTCNKIDMVNLSNGKNMTANTTFKHMIEVFKKRLLIFYGILVGIFVSGGLWTLSVFETFSWVSVSFVATFFSLYYTIKSYFILDKKEKLISLESHIDIGTKLLMLLKDDLLDSKTIVIESAVNEARNKKFNTEIDDESQFMGLFTISRRYEEFYEAEVGTIYNNDQWTFDKTDMWVILAKEDRFKIGLLPDQKWTELSSHKITQMKEYLYQNKEDKMNELNICINASKTCLEFNPFETDFDGLEFIPYTPQLGLAVIINTNKTLLNFLVNEKINIDDLWHQLDSVQQDVISDTFICIEEIKEFLNEPQNKQFLDKRQSNE